MPNLCIVYTQLNDTLLKFNGIEYHRFQFMLRLAVIIRAQAIHFFEMHAKIRAQCIEKEARTDENRQAAILCAEQCILVQ